MSTDAARAGVIAAPSYAGTASQNKVCQDPLWDKRYVSGQGVFSEKAAAQWQFKSTCEQATFTRLFAGPSFCCIELANQAMVKDVCLAGSNAGSFSSYRVNT